jgi:hypothetical protein
MAITCHETCDEMRSVHLGVGSTLTYILACTIHLTYGFALVAIIGLPWT